MTRINLRDGMGWEELHAELVKQDMLRGVEFADVQFIDSPWPTLYVGVGNLLALTINTDTGEVEEVG